eukprot:15477664-Alexandrium_andersonii.AAC.1
MGDQPSCRLSVTLPNQPCFECSASSLATAVALVPAPIACVSLVAAATARAMVEVIAATMPAAMPAKG